MFKPTLEDLLNDKKAELRAVEKSNASKQVVDQLQDRIKALEAQIARQKQQVQMTPIPVTPRCFM